ncbi:MAG: R3H domain-containing nucleic acid-binding protein [Patescibacteria group bacterium]|nr:KH domain-containing protein [Patescibacteria group bacterium]MBU1953192.1 KH domain-containing protein [Patescibacteria group bacterium]
MKHMDIKEVIETNLKKIFSLIGIKPEYSIESDEEGVYNVKISGDNLNFLIGFRGQSLEALQTLLKLIVFRKTEQQIVLSVDINSYKNQKSERLQEMARGFIDKVRFFEKEIELPVMNPWERRQIHVFVAEYEDVISESTGEGESRRVVLKPNKVGSKKKEK